ncbi:MAG TPA: NAD-dependent DNA ligase LigA [Haliscomenobacter sp.]|uniref:NAD-dependent DNA ligase LigA n=1 Tax=Haliscomenobacter sp. TaxID=2717303 RepID=UPI002CDBD1E5|nr:NAD-dependent DNA ligase LigA [Haliscomenobacter sp.]HOY20123.1 NAD-dependent DNA ligase LigA [Haliscomenobacter sp.]HPH20609.1 NAD-dependent DNA ligase LigA [Haliscomenobacter sp.]
MYTQSDQKSLYERSKAYLQADHTVHSQAPAQQHADLCDLIIYHEWRYYIQNDPVVSDYEYDQLFKLLERLEEAHPELVSADSPSQRVSADLTEDFSQVEHLIPMLSLANSYNAEDLNDWDASIKRFLNIDPDTDLDYGVEPKFDGGSIALVYENDVLVRAATRGNGIIGEEITNNAKVIRSIPLRAEFSKYGIHRVELRGEVLIRKDVFEKMNAKRAAEGITLFANARNTATGGLRIKDPKEVAKRGLEAFIYTLGYATDQAGNNMLNQFATHLESLELLEKLGFKVPVQERKLCNNIHEVIDFCNYWQQQREGYAYEIDGMVAKVNSRELQERSGFTSHHPRWAIAFKFQAKQATSKLLNVEYQVGKIGSITPVAKLEPVQLAGVTVSSVSLHNEDFITSRDLRLGDTVLVERAGDVIPYIVKAMDELRDGSEVPIVFPKFCPINDTETPVELLREGEEAAWRCPNCVCGQQDLQRIIFHVSKDAMDIDGMGKQIVERFFELGWVRNFADVYQLDYAQMAQLEGFGEKSATKLQAAIEKAKKNPISRVLYSLSIHHLGKKVSKLLAAEINHVLDLKDWQIEDYTKIKDVGPVVAANAIEFFQNEHNIELLQQMEALGVNLQQTEEDKPKAASADAPLAGKTILFTGSLAKMGRKEAQEKAEAAGAKNISAVSKNLDILVVGEDAGSKLKKARELGTVMILTEYEFLTMVEGG